MFICYVPAAGHAMSMTRNLSALLRALLLALILLPLAQTTALLAQETGGDTTSEAAPAIDPAKVEDLVKTLENPEERAKLIEQLQVLSQVQDEPESDVQSVDEFGLSLLELLSNRMNELASASVELTSAFVNLPVLYDWLWQQVMDETQRQVWIQLFTRLAAVIGTGLLAYLLTRYFLRPTIHRFYDERPKELTTVVPLALLRAGLRCIPIFVFAATGYGLLTILGGWTGDATSVLGRSLVDATTFCMALVLAARTILAPNAPGLRLIHNISDDTAEYLFIWIKRFILLIAYSYVIFQNEYILNIRDTSAGVTVADSISGAIQRALGFVVVLMLVYLVFSNRKTVAKWLRGNGAREKDKVLRALGRCRRLVADIWPVFAIFYILSTYLIWALSIPGGFSLLFRGGVLTTFLLAIARPLAYGVERALGQGLSLGEEIRRRSPALERRINRYLYMVQGFAVSLVYFLILLALVHIWGFDLFAWIGNWFTDETWDKLSRVGSIILISFLIWELVGTLIENHLDAVDDTGKRIERSGRTRTLLPLLRTFLFLLILTTVTLTTLSTLGVDVTPVLAAAGVVGIAIGFGSQKLVQDVITGLFILFQDTIAVSDVVEVAGHTGTVERISVRTIELRDVSGRVHTVPFSEVTTITNHTKDFSYAELDIGIAYREDTDEVTEVIKQVGAELEMDPAHAANIIEPIQVFGVDQLGDSAVVIKARIKTKPLMQWSVKRGFNRLVKYRFDELGIEMPFPHQTVYFGEDKGGKAPAAHVQVGQAAPEKAPAKTTDKGQKKAAAAKQEPADTSALRVVEDRHGAEEDS